MEWRELFRGIHRCLSGSFDIAADLPAPGGHLRESEIQDLCLASKGNKYVGWLNRLGERYLWRVPLPERR